MTGVGVICLILTFWQCALVTGADQPDTLPVVEVQIGLENKAFIDKTRKPNMRNDTFNNEMILEFKIVFYRYKGKRYIRCIGFAYGDRTSNCYKRDIKNGLRVLKFPLNRDEFITKVSGSQTYFITSIQIETNKRTFGPFGSAPDDPTHRWTAYNDGTPLLYVNINKGLWVYSMTFGFYVLDLSDVTDKIANETFNAINGRIEDLCKIKKNNRRMLSGVARMGCYYLELEKTKEAESACDLEVILTQINILTTASTAYVRHEPKNLNTYKDFDTQKYLDEVKESKDFHDLLTTMEFGLSTVVRMTNQQSQDLRKFFVSTADYDMRIAQKELAATQNFLVNKKKDTEQVTKEIASKLSAILITGMTMASANVIEKSLQLAAIMASMFNPIAWLTGSVDLLGMFEALSALLSAIKNLVKLAVLFTQIEDLQKFCEDMSLRFQENQVQSDAMVNLIDVLTSETDSNKIDETINSFVQSYGDYKPGVTNQDIVELITLLQALASEACDIINELDGTVVNGLVLNQIQVMNDCMTVSADIAVLRSLFEDTYSLQFDLLNSLKLIAKGTIAKNVGGRIGAIEESLDIKTAAIGAAIVETNYQAASAARCDILEYNNAGKRPVICLTLLFRDDAIQKLIAYTGSLSSSQRYIFGFIPTTKQDDPSIPSIDIESLLRGHFVTLSLPIQNKEWMKEQGWLPYVYDPETAFYIKNLEIYIPGLRCNESSASHGTVVTVKATSDQPTSLYAEEAAPKYINDKHTVTFEYSENRVMACPGKEVEFPVKDSVTMQYKEDVEICVMSHGSVSQRPKADRTHPSLFSTWTVQVMGGFGCTLVVDDSLDYQPMITVKAEVQEVYAKESPSEPGLDECWPDGSRCQPGEICVNELLSYSCTRTGRKKQLLLQLISDLEKRTAGQSQIY